MHATNIAAPRTSVPEVDVHLGPSEHSLRNRIGRLVWGWAWCFLFRPTPRVCHGWRRFLLRLFGAQIGAGVRVYPTAQIWAPWNLVMEENSCIGPQVDCYCVSPIRIEAHAVVSQYTYLCAASHDPSDPAFPLIHAPIVVGRGTWVAADVFIGMGVTIGEGAVVGARSSVFKDVEPWTIVGGNPARFLKRRELKHS